MLTFASAEGRFGFRLEQSSALMAQDTNAGEGPKPCMSWGHLHHLLGALEEVTQSTRARTCSHSGEGFWLREMGYPTPAPSPYSPAPACPGQPASAGPSLFLGLAQKKTGTLPFLPCTEISGTGINTAFAVDSVTYVLREGIFNICYEYSSGY